MGAAKNAAAILQDQGGPRREVRYSSLAGPAETSHFGKIRERAGSTTAGASPFVVSSALMLILAVLFAANMSYATPMAYKTNLLS